MRDKARIEPLLDKIQAFWLDNQDLRLGQIVYMLAEHLNHPDIFFPEDDVWDKAIDKLIERSCEKYKKHECEEEHDCDGCRFIFKDGFGLPCVMCKGTEYPSSKGYKNNCYYEEYK